MVTPGYDDILNDGGVSFFEYVEKRPATMFEIIDEWTETAWKAYHGQLEGNADIINVRRFVMQTDELAFWCDTFHAGVNPEPLMAFTRQVVAIVTGRPGPDASREKMKRIFHRVWLLRQRIIRLAVFDYHKHRLGISDADPDDLVTIDDIAETCHRSPASFAPVSMLFPKPPRYGRSADCTRARDAVRGRASSIDRSSGRNAVRSRARARGTTMQGGGEDPPGGPPAPPPRAWVHSARGIFHDF